MDNKSITAISIVAMIAILGMAFATVDFSSKEDKIVQVANVGFAPKSVQVKDNGNVWEVLKSKGLQGEHYTLNIHGKDDKFNKQDCTNLPDPITGEYGNNIFIPSNDGGAYRNQIIMSSGNAKGKWASTATTTYGVRDSCTAAFDGDAAELVLPPNEKGYFVVARVLGKPTNNPELSLTGDLLWVNDESNNDLLVLGLVTDNGFETPTTTLSRTKGKTDAVDITGLFEWNGQVCYFNDTNYCYDEFGAYTCTQTSMCCIDLDMDGIYDDACVAPTIDAYGNTTCPIDYTMTTLGCKEYVNEWVFNIGDFVGYMWDTFATGDFKLANIRFYPVQ